jgi:transcriptional regulator with XRE-family HTH domain
MILSKKEMGLLVKKARKKKSEKLRKKYTQTMLAKDLKLSRGYIGDIENGRLYPNYILLSKIAEKCEVPFGFFCEKESNCTSIKSEEFTESSIIPVLPPTPLEITDIKKALDLILSQPKLMLNGELLQEEGKIALSNAIEMGLAYVAKIESINSFKVNFPNT